MFQKIGRGETTGRPVVLTEFNGNEQMAFDQILWSARGYAETLKPGSKSRVNLEMMIDELNRVYELEG